MVANAWTDSSRKILVCFDEYQNGIPSGRICVPLHETELFCSLTQFLIKMETLLDDMQNPQAYTQLRSFAASLIPLVNQAPPPDIRTGRLATFEIQVVFRQHTSWQGVIVWLEQRKEQSFRSVLELVMLIDSVLRDQIREVSA